LIKLILGFLWAILRTLLYGWILGLIQVVREIWARTCRAARKKHLPGRQGKASPKPCVNLSDPAVKRPDPLIYDQYYLMALGFAVTWDNPDIWLELGGVVVPSGDLKPNTTYDVVARIWNSSTEGVVVGLPVHFSYLSFGAGVKSNTLKPGPDTISVDLGVKGSPECPAFARTKWTTPAAGHYCLQAPIAAGPAGTLVPSTLRSKHLGMDAPRCRRIREPVQQTARSARSATPVSLLVRSLRCPPTGIQLWRG